MDSGGTTRPTISQSGEAPFLTSLLGITFSLIKMHANMAFELSLTAWLFTGHYDVLACLD